MGKIGRPTQEHAIRRDYERVSILLPPDLARGAKRLAAQRGESVNELVRRLLRRAVNRSRHDAGDSRRQAPQGRDNATP